MSEQTPFRVEATVEAPHEDVWRAVTEPDRIARWFGWEYDGLASEIKYIFIDHARQEPPGLVDLDDGNDRQKIELFEEGSHTRVVITRPGAVQEDDDAYEDVREGWITFLGQLRHSVERHPDEDRRTIYLSGDAVPADAADALGRRLSGSVWHRGRFQHAVAAGGDGDLLAGIRTKLPVDSREPAEVALTVTSYGLDDESFARLKERWESWWAALAHEPARVSDPSFSPDRAGLEAALGFLLRELAEPSGAALDLPAALPPAGLGELPALERLAPSVVGGARRLGDPGFLAHMDPPTPWVAWAGAQWAAALNQNLLHDDSAPVARALEKRVVEWLAPFFGMSGGHLVPGSSVANLTALWAARELRGVEEVVTSEVAHLSVRKAAALLGLGFRVVGVDERQRLRPDMLGDLSRAALVLTAGTTVTGAVDPLDAGESAAWRHVDAAWAGPLLLSERHAGLLGEIDTADSVAVSAHKWLFQPKESALVLFADVGPAHDAISFGSGYLPAPNVGVLGSHGAAALPLAATLLAWGRAGMAERIDRCMAIASRLTELVEADERLELCSGPETGVVVWRPLGDVDLDELRGRMARGFVSIAELDGRRRLRSVSANPMADPELVVAEVLRAAAL